jgi:hypothetical protein
VSSYLLTFLPKEPISILNIKVQTAQQNVWSSKKTNPTQCIECGTFSVDDAARMGGKNWDLVPRMPGRAIVVVIPCPEAMGTLLHVFLCFGAPKLGP